MIKWKKSTWKRHIDLYEEESVLGRIEFKSIWKQDAAVQLADHKFSVSSTGFWKKTILFREDEGFVEDKELARLRLNAWRTSGTITMADGLVYHWKSDNIWNNRWRIEDETGEVLLRFQERFSWNYKGEVYELAEWPDSYLRFLLILIGVFAVSIYRENASAAAAT